MPEVFEYEGYQIPKDLAYLTGGGADTWDVVTKAHMGQYQRYTPLRANHFVLEIGCGVGRDAISLTRVLSEKGRYVGVDIIRPSIDWCTANITPGHPNFTFHHFDVYSQIHNPAGQFRAKDVAFPVGDHTVDRIALHSVFTHMFREDILHYMREFWRVLKPDGLVLASCFVLDDDTRAMASTNSDKYLTFRVPYGDGCWVYDNDAPEGAIGYAPGILMSMIDEAGLKLARPIARGSWCGREALRGQAIHDTHDMMVLRVKARGRLRWPWGRR